MLRLVLLDDALFETEAAVDDLADLLIDVALFKNGEQFRVASRLAFTDSARPLMYWRRGRVARVLGSTMTSLGCQKEPTMFFVSPRSTAVLPPMEESIIERVVVGQLMKSMPRI